MCIERPKICVIFYINPAPGDVGALCKSVVTVHIGGAIVDVAGVERDVSRCAVDGRVVDLRTHPVARLERVEHPTYTWINDKFKRIRHACLFSGGSRISHAKPQKVRGANPFLANFF